MLTPIRRLLSEEERHVASLSANRRCSTTDFPLEVFHIGPSHFHIFGLAAEQIPRHAVVAALADRCSDFLLRTAATETHSHSLIRSHLRNQAVEFANTRDVLTVDAQDDVVFSQAGFLGRTVFDHLRDADAAHLAHVIAAHVLAADIFRINAQKTAAVDQKLRSLIQRFVGRGRRRRRGLLSERDTRGQNDSGQETDQDI